MKNGAFLTGRLLLDGAARIVTVPKMHRTWRLIDEGSIEADWQAAGIDLRRSMQRKGEHALG